MIQAQQNQPQIVLNAFKAALKVCFYHTVQLPNILIRRLQ